MEEKAAVEIYDVSAVSDVAAGAGLGVSVSEPRIPHPAKNSEKTKSKIVK